MLRKVLFTMAALLLGTIACNGGQPPINVKPAPVTFSQSTGCPTAQVGVAYTCTLTASGGNGTYTWTQPSGTVPPGLTWAAAASPAKTATISGTPTVYGSYAPTFQVCDSETTPLCGSAVVDPHVEPAIQVRNTTNFTVSAHDPGCLAEAYWKISVFQVGYEAYICATSGLCSGMTVSITDSAGNAACSTCTDISSTAYTLPSVSASPFAGDLCLSFLVPADVAGSDPQIALKGSCA